MDESGSLLPMENDPVIPDGSMLATEVLVTQYIRPDGSFGRRTYYQGDGSITQVLGLLVAACIDIYGRTSDEDE